MSKQFMTIREVAKLGLLSEYRMRILQHQRKLPGVQSGRRYLVNVSLLREQLDAESRANVKKEPAGGDAA